MVKLPDSLPSSQPRDSVSPLLVRNSGQPTLLGVPYDASSSFLRGAAEGPASIREALQSPSANLWTEDVRELAGKDAIADAGDLEVPPDAAGREAIEQGVATLLAAGATPLVLGGDHSITYPVLRAIAAVHAPVTILHLDAHADLYDVFEGDRFSHACPFARIMEEGLAHRLVQVGVRTLTGHQRRQADRFGVEIIDMRAWTAGMRPRVEGRVYISVDLDVLDPAYAPGVSHWEPGGLTTRDLLTLIQSIACPVVGADVVEFNPSRDASGLTAMVAAKVVKELTAVMRST